MPKYTIFGLGMMLIMFYGLTGTLAGAGLDAVYLPVGTLTIAAPRGVVAKRAPVAFPHSNHFGYTCKTCHHGWDGFAPVKGCAASGCHDMLKVTASKPDVRYFKTAYHQKCIACHKHLTRERQNMEFSKKVLSQPLPQTGPSSCVGCHPRNNHR